MAFQRGIEPYHKVKVTKYAKHEDLIEEALNQYKYKSYEFVSYDFYKVYVKNLDSIKSNILSRINNPDSIVQVYFTDHEYEKRDKTKHMYANSMHIQILVAELRPDIVHFKDLCESLGYEYYNIDFIKADYTIDVIVQNSGEISYDITTDEKFIDQAGVIIRRFQIDKDHDAFYRIWISNIGLLFILPDEDKLSPVYHWVSSRTAKSFFRGHNACDFYVGNIVERSGLLNPIRNFLAEQLYYVNSETGCDGFIWQREHRPLDEKYEDNVYIIANTTIWTDTYHADLTWFIDPENGFASNYIMDEIKFNTNIRTYARCKDYAICCPRGRGYIGRPPGVRALPIYVSVDGLDWRMAATIPVYKKDETGKEVIDHYENPVNEGEFGFSHTANSGIMLETDSPEGNVYRIDVTEDKVTAKLIRSGVFGGRVIGDVILKEENGIIYCYDSYGNKSETGLPTDVPTLTYDYMDGTYYAYCVRTLFPGDKDKWLCIWTSNNGFRSVSLHMPLMWSTDQPDPSFTLEFFNGKAHIVQTYSDIHGEYVCISNSIDSRPNMYIPTFQSVYMRGALTEPYKIEVFRGKSDYSKLTKEEIEHRWFYTFSNSHMDRSFLYFKNGKVATPQKYYLEVRRGGDFNIFNYQAYFAVFTGINRSQNRGAMGFDGRAANQYMFDSANQTF